MLCPRDGSALVVTRYEADVEIDVCPACQGTFLDQGELETIQRTVERDHTRRKIDAFDAVKEAFVAVEQQIAPRIACPRSQGSMATRTYGMGSQIVIDECVGGCGVWLHGGELAALERFYEAAQAASPLPLHWRAWAGIVGLVRGTRRS